MRVLSADEPGSPLPRFRLGRDFLLYAVGRAVSSVGDRIALIALVFYIVHLSHSFPPALAIFYVCRVLPSLFGGLLAGVYVDHVDRRRLMITCDGGRAVVVAAIAVLTSGHLFALYPLVFALFALTLLFETAAKAALPDVVPEEKMLVANSFLRSIDTGADLFYAVGGVLVFALGFQLPFLLDAATFLFSAIMIWSMHIPYSNQATILDLNEMFDRIKEGIAYVWSHSFLRWSTLTYTAAPLAGGIGFVVTPLYASQSLATSSGLVGPLTSGVFRFGLLEVSLGVGALVGSFLVGPLAAHFPRGTLFGIGITGVGVFDAMLGFVSNVYIAAAAVLCSGIFNSLFLISGMTLVQALTPSEVRGRVFAARFTIIHGALAIGSALAGALLLSWSPQTLWLLDGAIIIASSGLVWFNRAVRGQQ